MKVILESLNTVKAIFLKYSGWASWVPWVHWVLEKQRCLMDNGAMFEH